MRRRRIKGICLRRIEEVFARDKILFPIRITLSIVKDSLLTTSVVNRNTLGEKTEQETCSDDNPVTGQQYYVACTHI